MIGLALVTLVAVLSAGIISSFKGAVNDILTADYAITAQNNFSPIPIARRRARSRDARRDRGRQVRAGEGRRLRQTISSTGRQPAGGRVFNLDWTHGSHGGDRDLGANGAFVDNGYANKHHLQRRLAAHADAPTAGAVPLVVKGIFEPPDGGSPFGPSRCRRTTWDRAYSQPQNLYTLVKMRGGETAANRPRSTASLGASRTRRCRPAQQFIDNQISGLKRVLNILYVLLALSIIVSLFGIVNTLVLSVFERTREIGMLRAVGTSRRQIRRMIRHESVITALIGSVLGIVLGIAFGALLAARVTSIAFIDPGRAADRLPDRAVVVGLLAAIFPARRASRLQPLQALAYE